MAAAQETISLQTNGDQMASKHDLHIISLLEKGPMTLKELAKKVGIDPNNLGKVMNSLRNFGLAERAIAFKSKGRPWVWQLRDKKKR